MLCYDEKGIVFVQEQNIWADSEGDEIVSAGTSLARQDCAEISTVASLHTQKEESLHLY